MTDAFRTLVDDALVRRALQRTPIIVKAFEEAIPAPTAEDRAALLVIALKQYLGGGDSPGDVLATCAYVITGMTLAAQQHVGRT